VLWGKHHQARPQGGGGDFSAAEIATSDAVYEVARDPDTQIAPTGAYLSNYGYPAYRAYRAAPTGRQSDASLTAGAS
jgi:hypothetical protein